VEFNMPLIDFADSLSPEDMQAWAAQMQAAVTAQTDGGAEKKS
jgi:predicted PhzF superfamily epimerase YddE/YHI9